MKQMINTSDPEALRQKAEDSLKKYKSNTNVHYLEADNLKPIHELQVHQIELNFKMKNLFKQMNGLKLLH